MDEDKVMRAIVHGKVQGVFFRAAACRHGRKLGLTGTAKNLPDGTVEIWARGPEEKLQLFLELIEDDPGMGEVEQCDVGYSECDIEFRGFEIVY